MSTVEKHTTSVIHTALTRKVSYGVMAFGRASRVETRSSRKPGSTEGVHRTPATLHSSAFALLMIDRNWINKIVLDTRPFRVISINGTRTRIEIIEQLPGKAPSKRF